MKLYECLSTLVQTFYSNSNKVKNLRFVGFSPITGIGVVQAVVEATVENVEGLNNSSSVKLPTGLPCPLETGGAGSIKGGLLLILAAPSLEAAGGKYEPLGGTISNSSSFGVWTQSSTF